MRFDDDYKNCEDGRENQRQFRCKVDAEKYLIDVCAEYMYGLIYACEIEPVHKDYFELNCDGYIEKIKNKHKNMEVLEILRNMLDDIMV